MSQRPSDRTQLLLGDSVDVGAGVCDGQAGVDQGINQDLHRERQGLLPTSTYCIDKDKSILPVHC